MLAVIPIGFAAHFATTTASRGSPPPPAGFFFPAHPQEGRFKKATVPRPTRSRAEPGHVEEHIPRWNRIVLHLPLADTAGDNPVRLACGR